MFDSCTSALVTKLPPTWITFILLVSTLLRLTECCFRSSTPEPVTKVAVDPTMDTDHHASHKLPCFSDEVQSMGCLNGGTCYALKMESRQLLCGCTDNFVGRRCHLYYIDPKLYEVRQENLRMANLAAGVSVCILLAFVILFAVWVYIRYWRRNRQYLAEDQHKTAPSLTGFKQHIIGESALGKGTAGSNGQKESCEVEVNLTTESMLLAVDGMKESRL